MYSIYFILISLELIYMSIPTTSTDFKFIVYQFEIEYWTKYANKLISYRFYGKFGIMYSF